MENHAKETLLNLFPERFNKTNYEKASLEEIMVIMKECFDELRKDGTLKGKSKLEHALSPHSHPPNGGEHHVHGHRKRRGAGGNHQHTFHDKEKHINHHILHELTHAFHLGSMVILTVLLVEVNKKFIKFLWNDMYQLISFLPHRELKLILVRSQMHDYFWLFLNRGLYRELFL